MPRPDPGASSSSRSRQYIYNRLPRNDSSDSLSSHSSSHSDSLRRTHSHDNSKMKGTMTTMGKVRAYWLATVVCMAGLLFGYDTGIVGGVLTFDSFMEDYNYPEGNSRVSSLTVGLQQLGAFVSCFIVWPITERIGRRMTIAIAAFIFIIGAMIQTINTHSLTAFYISRVIAGLGLGSASVVVPMFNSEMAPKEIRGQVGSFFQFFFTIGIFLSYWVDYAVARNVAPGTSQWQIPIGLQILPAGIMGLGMLTLPESARWLAKQGRHEQAWKSLSWIRADDGPAAQAEMEEIRTGVEIELAEVEGFRMKELLDVKSGNLKRVWTAFIIFMAQQSTGATAFAYFGPQYFSIIVGDDADMSLLLTAIFGAVKVAACGFFVVFLAERISRRGVLIGGALFMAACQITTAAVVKTIPAEEGTITSAGIATIALIYMFVMAYNFSWGPLPWPYVSEIFPSRIRAPGMAVGVASQWLFNFTYSIATPYMIENLGWGTFLLWGIFDFCIAACTFMFMRETRGLSLEHIAHTDFKRKAEGAKKVDDTDRESVAEAAETTSHHPKKLNSE